MERRSVARRAKTIIAICFISSIAAFFAISMPMPGEVDQAYLDMQDALSVLLARGGKISSRDDLSKFGLVVLERDIGLLTTEPDDFVAASEDLVSMGWTAAENVPGSYCRNGTRFEVVERTANDGTTRPVKYKFRFDGATRRACK